METEMEIVLGTEVIRISGPRGSDVEFQGRRVTQAASLYDEPSAYGRWFEVAVYHRSDDMWVVHIVFHTSCLYETPHANVEVVDRANDVEAVLMIYEPTEYLNRDWIQPRNEVDRHRFMETLRRRFDELTGRVSAELRPYEDPMQRDVEAEEIGLWRGLLSLFKIG
jgi:hypothetical protein